MADHVLTQRALNRALLARQLLLHRVTMPVTDAVEHLVGLQAQVPANPYVALWSRLDAFEPGELADALLDRRLVRTAVMRSTIHLVTADDALTLRPLVHEVLARELRQKMFAPHVDGLDLVPVLAAGRAALEERPMTASELGRVLAERWPDRSPAALSHAVRCLVPLVQVPPRGLWGRSGRSLHAPTDSWLGRPVDPAPSLDAMLLRYLAAFGPATVADMRTWSGLTGLGSAVDRLRPQLKTFRDDRGRELLDLPDAPRPDADTPAPPIYTH